MNAPIYQALVVDDEPSVRMLTMRALGREGFQCHAAADGNEASQLVRSQGFDVVVTDLRMPHKHGHALAVELLAMDERPLIVVLTGVIEPRLAKDLMIRGVDDIVFKPVDYGTFAAKMKALVHRRRRAGSQSSAEPAGPVADVSDDPFPERVSDAPEVLPLVPAALEVYRMANSNEFDAPQIAGAIAKHALLSDEVIQLANRRFYNRAGTKVTNLERAVVQIGQKRIGQLALAANAIAALAREQTDCLNMAGVRRQSVAAGLAIELLIAQGDHHEIEDGLLLCATMHSVGQLFLGSLFPKQYQAAVQRCVERNEPLVEHECRMFPRSQSEVLLDVLADWNVSDESTAPLQHVSQSYNSLAELSEPIRSQTELVKLAVLIAQITLAQWAPWDLVEFPPEEVLRRLRVFSVSSVIDETEANLAGVNPFQTQPGLPATVRPINRDGMNLAYANASPGSFDFLAEVLRTLGFVPISPVGQRVATEPRVVNCLDMPADEAVSWLSAHQRPNDVIVCDPNRFACVGQVSKTVALPNSISALLLGIEGNKK